MGDDAEGGCIVRWERVDGASSGWFDGPGRSRSIGDGTVRSGGVTAVAALGRAQLGAEIGLMSGSGSMKPASHRCGQAGSMPRALRFQEDREVIADLFGSTALVLSER